MTVPRWRQPWPWVCGFLLLLHTALPGHGLIYEGDCELDLVFLVDSGHSTGRTYFDTLLKSIVSYIDELPVAPEAVHVGVVAFSTTMAVQSLTGDMEKLRTGIMELFYDGRYTNTHKAFQMAYNWFQSSERVSAPKVVVLITDGVSRFSEKSKKEAAKLRAMGVTIWAIGLGFLPPVSELRNFVDNDVYKLVLTSRFTRFPSNIDLPLNCRVTESPHLTSSLSVAATSSIPPLESSSMLESSSTIFRHATSSSSFYIDLSHTESLSEASIQPTSTQKIDHTSDRVSRFSSHASHTETRSLNHASHVTETGSHRDGEERKAGSWMTPTQTAHSGHHWSTSAYHYSSEHPGDARLSPSVRPSHTANSGAHTRSTSGLPGSVSVMASTSASFRDIRPSSVVPHHRLSSSSSSSWSSSSQEPLCATMTTTTNNNNTTNTNTTTTATTTADGFRFESHPTDCDKFVQCLQSEDGGHVTASIRLCPRGMFWRPDKGTCVEPVMAECKMDPCRDGQRVTYSMDGGCGFFWRCERGVSLGRSCHPGHAYVTGKGCVPAAKCTSPDLGADLDKDMCESNVCQEKPLPGNRGYRAWLHLVPGHWVSLPCLFGATFDLASCSCLVNRPFSPQCPHVSKIVMVEKSNDTRTENPAENRTQRPSFVFDPTSSRPTALNFRYRPSQANDDDNGDGSGSGDNGNGDDDSTTESALGEVLLRSATCPDGGIVILSHEDATLKVVVFSRDGYSMMTSLLLKGLNTTSWRTVQVRYTVTGDLSIRLDTDNVTYTSFVAGGMYIPVSLCGWEVGDPGTLYPVLHPFKGDIEEIYVSRCYDHGF